MQRVEWRRRAACIVACVAALVGGCATGASSSEPDAGAIASGDASATDLGTNGGRSFEPVRGGFAVVDGTTMLEVRDGTVSLRPVGEDEAALLLGATRIEGLHGDIARLTTQDPQRVEWEHGGWVERFDIVPDGLEQTWVLRDESASGSSVHVEVPLESGTRVLGTSDSEIWLANDQHVVRYGALHAFDAAGRTLPAVMSASADHLSIDVDASDAVYPVTIDPLIAIVGEVLAPAVAGGNGSTFGASVAVSAGRIAVGDPGFELRTTQPGGFVHLYQRDARRILGECSGIALPSSSGIVAGDQLGHAVALESDLLVVSTPRAGGGRGGVWVIDLSGGFAPAERAAGEAVAAACSYVPNRFVLLKTPVGVRGFGRRVAISGRRVAVSSDTGSAVWTFAASDGRWQPEATLAAPAGAGDFGASLSLHDGVLAVGAPTTAGGGSAYVFTHDGTNWSAPVRIASVAGDSSTGRAVAVASRDVWVSSVRSGVPVMGLYRMKPVGLGRVAELSGVAQGAVASASASAGMMIAGAPSASSGELLGNRTVNVPSAAVQLGSAVATDGELAVVSYRTTGSARITGSSTTVGRVLLMRVLSDRGDSCGSASTCASGFCVDGVCCESACGGGANDCQACSVAGGGTRNGSCTALSATAAPQVECREAVASCDAPEMCVAGSTVCPSDRYVAAGAICGAADSGESLACGGDRAACPGELAPVDDETVARFGEMMGAEDQAVDALVAFNQQMNSLTREQRSRVWCRNARIFERRAPLVLLALQQSGASAEEIDHARTTIHDSAEQICAGREPESAMRALGVLSMAANRRMTSGSALDGRDDVFLGSLAALRDEFGELCMADAMPRTLEAYAGMSDAQFDRELDTLALGRCASRGPAGGHFEIVAPRTYGDCVRDAMRASATRSVESCNSPVAGGGSDDPPEDDGEGDGGDGEGDDAEEPHPAPNPPPMTPNPALDEQNRREAETAVGEMVVGVVLMVGGAAVIFVGAAVAGGTLGGGTPVALGLGAAGLSLASMGLGIARGGIDRREGARRDWAERNGTTPPFLCPTMRSPAGFLSFAASRPGDGSGSSGRRMSVLDAMRACACENNPLDAILAGLPGPFGGNSCELGARLRCLREEDDDVATPMDPECARLLGEDNQESLSSQLQQCGIISCGTDSWVTPDCRCESMSGGGLGGGFDACEHVLCPEGTVPRPNGYSCACTPPDEHVGPSIPGVECIPGFPCAGGGGGTPPTPPFP